MNNKITIKVINDISLIGTDWDRLFDENEHLTPFQSRSITEVWLNTYSYVKQNILIAISNDIIVGIAPLIIVKQYEFGLSFNKLQFIGANNFDYLDFIIHKDFDYCGKLFVEYIALNSEGWNICEFNNIKNTSIYISHFKSLGINFYNYNKNVCPVLYLQSDYSNLLSSVNRGLRYDLKRGAALLSEKGELKYHKISNEVNINEELNMFFEMLSNRENFKKRIGTAESDLSRKLFFENLVSCKSISNIIHFTKITLNGNPIAYHFGFKYNGTLYWYKPTFLLNYSKYSPGKILISETLKCEISNGVKTLDFLMGNESYKYQWTSIENEIESFRIKGKGVYSFCLYNWFNLIRPFLKKIYNKKI